jgi:hypothetical protein
MSVVAAIPRVMLRVPSEAAEACGCSDEYFDLHIRPELRLIRKGRYTFVATKELQAWAERNSAKTLRGA